MPARSFTIPSVRPFRRLELCIACGEGRVQPQSWQRTPAGVMLLRRCPDCGVCEHAEHSRAETDRYGRVLDFDRGQLLVALRESQRDEQRRASVVFAAAVHAGHITAQDFARA